LEISTSSHSSDYEQALRWYESALEQDSTNTAAQFGKGAALHKLGRYEESNDVFDRMTVADQYKEGVWMRPAIDIIPARPLSEGIQL